MEYTHLEDLEAKVNKIVDRMNALHAENEELKKTNRDLEGRCHELEKVLEGTKQSLAVLESERSGWMEGQKEKEERIRAKVSSLLEKLDEWEE